MASLSFVRLLLLAGVAAMAVIAAMALSASVGSGGTPDQIIQGDTDCDGDVDADDALNTLQYVAGLPVVQVGECPDVGAVAAIPGPSGAPGSPGPPGPAGPTGEPGPLAMTDLEIVTEETSMAAVEDKSLEVTCPRGKTAISGGAAVLFVTIGVRIHASHPTESGFSWYAAATHDEIDATGDLWVLRVFAVCAFVDRE